MLRNSLSAFRDWPRLIPKLPPYRNCDADLIRSVMEEFPEHQGFSITTNLPTDILQAFRHTPQKALPHLRHALLRQPGVHLCHD